MILLGKTWSWCKKWGKWLLGFILALGGIIVFKQLVEEEKKPVPPIDLGSAAEELAGSLAATNRRRDAKLIELSERNRERLEGLSEDQERELQDLAEKPLEEVVKWFDRL